MPPELLPARRMTFTLNGTKLLLVSCTGVLQVLKVDALQPAIVHVFENQQLGEFLNSSTVKRVKHNCTFSLMLGTNGAMYHYFINQNGELALLKFLQV